MTCSTSTVWTSNALPVTSKIAGKARATVGRRLCTVVGFYRYAEEEGVIEHSPAVHIRRPRIDYESHVAHLDRNELGAILVTAGLSSPRDHALVSLLALNGLRVSEAIGADIDALGQERGHRTLTVCAASSRTPNSGTKTTGSTSPSSIGAGRACPPIPRRRSLAGIRSRERSAAGT